MSCKIVWQLIMLEEFMQQSRLRISNGYSLKKDILATNINTYLNLVQKQRGLKPTNQTLRDLFQSADPIMKGIQDQLWKLSDKKTPLLISGERGTGKSMICQALYEVSSYRNGPYIEFDAADCPTQKQEKELLGERANIKVKSAFDLDLDSDLANNQESKSALLDNHDSNIDNNDYNNKPTSQACNAYAAANDIDTNDSSEDEDKDNEDHFLDESTKLSSNHQNAKLSKGLVHKAQGGFLVIDNFNSLSLNLQNKLWKLISDRDLKKKSGLDLSTFPRIVFVTNSNVLQLFEKNRIKADLYHCLSSSHVQIPALRHRPQDIPFLSQIILAKLARHNPMNASLSDGAVKNISLTGAAMELLVHHNWPQNITELEKVLNEASVSGLRDRIEKEHIPLKQEFPKPKTCDDWIKNLPVGQALRTVETHFILETIKSHQGNRTYAARTLGISLRTLRNKINEFTVEGYEVMSPQSGRRSSAAAAASASASASA